MRDTQVLSLGQEDPLEKEMATHSSTLAWKTPWMKEPGSYSPWGHKESETTEQLQFTSSLNTLAKLMLKILQARLHSTWTENFQMFKLDLEKAEEPEIKLPTSAGSLRKQESFRKTYTSAL